MKNSILIVLLMFVISNLSAQGTVKLKLTLKDMKMSPLSFTKIKLVETSSGDSLVQKTDGLGVANFVIESGQRWEVFYLGVKDADAIEVPSSGNSTQNATLIYIPDSENIEKLIADRTNLKFEEIHENISTSKFPEGTKSIIRLKVLTNGDSPVRNIEVCMVDIQGLKKYITKTDNSGEARFFLENGKEYELDVDGIEGYDILKMPKGQGVFMRPTITYKPTEINETVKNDTIWQKLEVFQTPTSQRALISVNLQNYEREKLAGEIVTLDEQGSKNVYAGFTDKNGKIDFLLPKGKSYIVNFKYERGAKLIDITTKYGMVRETGIYSYRGSQNIEQFYKDAKRDMNGFMTEFMHVGAEPCQINSGYLEQTKDGYNINFESQSPASTPAIFNNSMVIGGGYYSPDLYSFDYNTGKFNWGLKLSESGISSAVYDDDMILVNTYSCTLYGVIASTGELKWSKWLGPVIYSAPSVYEGKVYAVYPNDINGVSNKNNEDYVMVCFDLKTGNIVWQNRIDQEAIASPVVAGDYIYASTTTGKMYRFNKADGTNAGTLNDFALGQPTVLKDNFYLPVKSKDSNKQEVAKYSVKDMKLIKRFTALASIIKAKKINELQPTEKMNYNHNQLVYSNNKNYQVVGKKLVCSNPDDGSIIWSSNIATNEAESSFTSTIPTVMADKIVIATHEGKIKILKASDGSVINEYSSDDKFWSQPAVHNGTIFAGTSNGKLVTVKTNDKSLTGWEMFGRNASHNLVSE